MGCDLSTPVVDTIDDGVRLAVIVVHFNPQGYRRRRQLVHESLTRMVAARQRGQPLQVIGVELTYDGAASDLTPAVRDSLSHYIHRDLPRQHVMWHKEQLINLAVAELQPKYFCWIDSDVEFTDDAWITAALQQLQSHPRAFGQVWSTCDLLDPHNRSTGTVTSFCQQWATGKTYRSRSHRETDEYWHPGFGWMTTWQAWTHVGHLLARTLGSADRHMAMALLGRAAETVPDGLHENYLDQVLEWQQLATEAGLQLVAVNKVHIRHYWHGSLQSRRYMERWQILVDYQFDPVRHLQADDTGLCTWSPDCPPELMAAVAEYFAHRQEDSQEMDEPRKREEKSRTNDGDGGGGGARGGDSGDSDNGGPNGGDGGGDDGPTAAQAMAAVMVAEALGNIGDNPLVGVGAHAAGEMSALQGYA